MGSTIATGGSGVTGSSGSVQAEIVGESIATNIINDISLKVYDLHHAFYENRKNACNLEIYGQ
jgi:hypothetical protein